MKLFQDWRAYREFQRLPDDQRNIVFYAESGQDWHHLQPLIERLAGEQQRAVCYISSDPTDPGLDCKVARLRTFCIRTDPVRILLFQFLRADVLVLTMMDLGNLDLKRSIHPVHYVYVFHSLTSTHMVDNANAYDHYDTLLCAGPHQMREIRRREAVAGLPAKQLIEHGYHRLDMLMTVSEQRGPCPPGNPPTLLLAPTWGEQSILNICGEQLVEILLEAGLNVVLRPHYETVKRHASVVEGLLRRFGAHPRLHYIDRMAESGSLFDSDLLITDWSGIAIEFALGLARPVLFVDVPRRARNPDYADLGLAPVEVTIRTQLGRIVSPEQLAQMPGHIQALLANPESFRERIRRLRHDYVFNIGRSAVVGAEAVAAIADARAAARHNGEKHR